MTPASFASYVRYNTRTNSTTLPNADILTLMGARQDDLAQEILKVDEDILLIPQYRDLVASSITAREYSLPQDILSRIKRIEAQLNGTDWIPLEEIDLGSIKSSISTEIAITNAFNNSQYGPNNPGGARFDMFRRSIYIYSGTITAGTDALRVYINTWPTHITNLASTAEMSSDPSPTTHGIPRELHKMWATGVIIDYKGSRQKPIPLSESELMYDRNLKKAIETLKHGNEDREILGGQPSAGETWNYGADL